MIALKRRQKHGTLHPLVFVSKSYRTKPMQPISSPNLTVGARAEQRQRQTGHVTVKHGRNKRRRPQMDLKRTSFNDSARKRNCLLHRFALHVCITAVMAETAPPVNANIWTRHTSATPSGCGSFGGTCPSSFTYPLVARNGRGSVALDLKNAKRKTRTYISQLAPRTTASDVFHHQNGAGA